MKYDLKRKRIDYISDEELFSELSRIWRKLGHRPSRIEWEKSNPKYSYITYRRHFNGWVNACVAFIDFISSGTRGYISKDDDIFQNETQKQKVTNKKRDIPDKLRISVLKRDNFKCVFCGRSPALEPGVILHIDHIIPFSKGGETVRENLQTLCNRCNWGKGKDALNPLGR